MTAMRVLTTEAAPRAVDRNVSSPVDCGAAFPMSDRTRPLRRLPQSRHEISRREAELRPVCSVKHYDELCNSRWLRSSHAKMMIAGSVNGRFLSDADLPEQATRMTGYGCEFNGSVQHMR